MTAQVLVELFPEFSLVVVLLVMLEAQSFCKCLLLLLVAEVALRQQFLHHLLDALQVAAQVLVEVRLQASLAMLGLLVVLLLMLEGLRAYKFLWLLLAVEEGLLQQALILLLEELELILVPSLVWSVRVSLLLVEVEDRLRMLLFLSWPFC